jgi:hypothetical protein
MLPAGGSAPGIFGLGGIKNLFAAEAAKKVGAKEAAKELGLKKTLGIMAGGSLLGTLAAGVEAGDEEAIEATRNVDALKTYLRQGYRNLKSFVKEDGTEDAEALEAQVNKDVSEYTSGAGGYAEGGRIEYASGSEDRFMELVSELRERGFSQQEAIEEARRILSEDKAMGGRIEAQQGGSIMPRLNQLGSGVSSAEQMLQGINQRLESAESSLGGGGVGQDVTGNNPMEIPVPFMGRPVLTEMPGYKGPRPQQKPLQQLQQADPNSFLLGVFQSRPEQGLGPTMSIPPSKSGIISAGGRMGFARGDTASDNAMQAAGIEGLPIRQNPKGVKELDLRETGGFIPPVGIKEKEDDIPAMLSNNEFVFTADAVRGMGEGNVNKGAERMYKMMKTLEAGGKV